MTNGAPVLEIAQLSVDYAAADGVVHAVKDVSLMLRRGEVLGLAGESGSGKSTLAYAIARLLPATAAITGGRVLYYPQVDAPSPRDGEGAGNGVSPEARLARGGAAVDVLALRARQLRAFRWSELAIVFQSAMNALNPVAPIAAQIDDVLRAHRPRMPRQARAARATELLALVGIAADRLGSYPHELSGGMRQRVGIAIALALAPDIIIMDEPTTALDVVVQREILSEILRLRERFNFSAIFITHDLSLLLELADTVAIMYAGRLVERAARRELYQRPCHPYSYGLMHAFPALRGPRRRALGIPGTPPDLRAVPPGCAFHPRCPLAFAPCDVVEPPLRPRDVAPARSVACHMYDPAYRAEPPALAEIEAAYATATARSEGL